MTATLAAVAVRLSDRDDHRFWQGWDLGVADMRAAAAGDVARQADVKVLRQPV